MLKPRISQLFGIEYASLMSGVRRLGRAEPVAAVGNAGGLGFRSAHSVPTRRALADEIAKTQALCSGPIGVVLPLLPYLDIRPEEYATTLIEGGVRRVVTSRGNAASLIVMFKSAGVRVLHKGTAVVRFAKKAEDLGADAVSITGFEAAGHPQSDDVSHLVLIPAAAAQFGIPIVFADGRGLVAALALGADGVSMGTRFALTRESILAKSVKRRYLAASEWGIRLIFRSLGDPTRVLLNQLAQDIPAVEKAGASSAEITSLASSQRWVDADLVGDLDADAFAVGLIRDLSRCADLMADLKKKPRRLSKNGGCRYSSLRPWTPLRPNRMNKL